MDSRVLSIQSHVVHGYVGNRCAILPLQLHGFEVDSVNSVQFSNHTAYQHWKGQVLSSEELRHLFEGLKLNSLNTDYTHVITGYIADESFLTELANQITELRRHNKDLFYICDPVLGDGGSYYVKNSLMPLYKAHLLPLANIITPNQFELGQLSDTKIDSENSCLAAIDKLHEIVGTIVVTSTDLSADPRLMVGYGSKKGAGKFRFEIQKLDATFLGTGDFFTTLLLVWYAKTNGDLKKSVRNTLSSMHGVLNFTLARARESAKSEGLEKPSPKHLELKLVKCQPVILNPVAEITISDL